MRTGLRILGVHSEDAVMIGDRMDTDMVAGIETGLDTVLVLSGVTRREDIAKFPTAPGWCWTAWATSPPGRTIKNKQSASGFCRKRIAYCDIFKGVTPV